jgi:chromate transporter
MQNSSPNKPTFKEALKFWVKLGFISFGGPAGQIAIMHEFLVDQKKWISDSRFMHALNYCMILPGPEAQQLATYIGWLLHGRWGGLAAGILFFLPSMFILLGLSIIYVEFGNIPWVYAIFNGLKPAVIAIVILALIKIASKALHGYFHYFIALAAFAGIFVFNIPFPLIIIGSILLSALAGKIFPPLLNRNLSQSVNKDIDEESYYINSKNVIKSGTFSIGEILRKVGIGLLFWLLPFLGFYMVTTDFLFWKKLILFFTQAAFVTFGGAYAVLPYVAQVSVEQYQWLTELQMVDGLALGETTPGPLIMVLTFVGFMAGYNYFAGSLALGAMALITTTWYTFLPCFLFIFAGAPIIERTQTNKKIKALLELVTAAVVGVILNLTIYLGQAVIFPQGVLTDPDYAALIWTAISLIALYRFNFGMIRWIGVSAVVGLVYYFML